MRHMTEFAVKLYSTSNDIIIPAPTSIPRKTQPADTPNNANKYSRAEIQLDIWR